MIKLINFFVRYLVSAAANIVLALTGWLPRFRADCYEAAYRLGWRKRPIVESGEHKLLIPEGKVADLVKDPVPVKVLEQDAADGNVSGYELLVISQLIAARKPRTCFEIGTFDGRTTLNLAVNADPECHVYTLDLPPQELDKTKLEIATGDSKFIDKEASGTRFSSSPLARNITQLYGDSATFDYSPYEGKMDVVFVDGAHSYDYVKSDTEVALRLLKPEGGLILWHDYSSPYWKDLTLAMNELYQDNPEFKTMRHVTGTVLVVWDTSW